jgi:cation:H+ antiporter
MLLATALLIIGLLLVVYSADRLVYAASILCRMLGIPPDYWHDGGQHRYQFAGSHCFRRRFLHGQTDLAIGTALGSNITNILLILGLAALFQPFTVHSDILRRELPLMLLVSLLAGFVLYDGQLTRIDGLFCWRWPCCGCCLPLKSPALRNARVTTA